MANKNKRLQELRGSDFEIVKGQPDIRGWEVRDNHGHLMGKVSELIFDSRAQKVRYMVVNVADSKELQLEKRTVLVPIGLAVLEYKNDDVILETVTPFQLRALPKYSSDDLGTRAERAIGEVFGRTNAKGFSDDDSDLEDEFYNDEHFNTENMHRKRRAEELKGSLSADTHNSLNEAEATSLRHEAKTNTVSHPVSDGTYVRDTEAPQQRGETDEEYIRRARKNLD